MKKALTIGELLITMAIIGTIATLVLPGFLKDYHKKIYVARLKKSVELIENAINQACIDNNVSYFYQTPYAASNDKTSAQAFIDKYFKTIIHLHLPKNISLSLEGKITLSIQVILALQNWQAVKLSHLLVILVVILELIQILQMDLIPVEEIYFF